MGLQPNQVILGAVQQGKCSDPDDINPFDIADRKRHAGWEQGHKSMVADLVMRQKYNDVPVWQKIKCKIGLHKYNLSHVPGRPHIRNNRIIGRDPIIKKYTCIHCPAVYFVGLSG